MTTTALAALQKGDIQLSDVEQLILTETEQDAAAFDLQPARIKIAPGGIGQFLMGDDTVKGFTAIVAISQKIRGYWPNTGAGQAPLCSSPDGSIGLFNADPPAEQFRAAGNTRVPHPGIVYLTQKRPLPETFSCATCPMNQWGSEHQRREGNGKGKACKEMRRLLLLIDGWTLPALMSLPPTSIRAWDTYCSGLAAKRSAYFAVKTKFTLDSARAAGGETYNVVQVAVQEKIEEITQLQLVAQIRQEYRSLVAQMPIVADEYDTVDAVAAPGAPAGEEEIPF